MRMKHLQIYSNHIKIDSSRFTRLGSIQGGALFLSGGYSLDYANISINNCRFVENIAEQGGAIYINQPFFIK
jgi:predicted outer membrane repeat protein